MDNTSWDRERFLERAADVQTLDGWQTPQAWAFGLMHCFKEKGEGGKDVEIELLARFKPGAINFGDNLNRNSLAHVVDVVGPEVFGKGVLLTKKQLKQLRKRVAWVDRDGTHCNVGVLDDFKCVDHGFYHPDGRGTKAFVIAIPDLTAELASIGDSYLRDYLFSMGVTDPDIIDCRWTDRFPLRPTFAVTSDGIMTPKAAEQAMWQGALFGLPTTVFSVDKVPFLLDHLIPEGVRIPSADTVRLGAHLMPGTTVMPGAGYVNIEAKVSGMVEGRVSGRVQQHGVLNEIGGGVSILGTMAGGNKLVVSLGSCNLLEAQSGLGIPLGDRCKVDFGHAVKSTSRVRVSGGQKKWKGNEVAMKAIMEHGERGSHGIFVRAEHLAGISDAIFRRNDMTGVNEVIPRGDHVWWDPNSTLLSHN